MKRNVLFQRILALFIAFLFIPLLLSDSGIGESESKQLSAASSQTVTNCDFYGFTGVIRAEEILPSGTSRISRCDSSGRPIQLKCIDYFFRSNHFLLYAAGVLYIILHYISRRICSSRKFIIKYIHDQDGYKNRPSFY